MTKSMIDSGVEWIGEVPSNWRIERLGNLFKQRNEKVSDYDFEPLSVTKKGIVKQLATAAKSNDHFNRKKVCVNDFVINSRSDRKMSSGISKFDGSVSLINIILYSKVMDPSYVNYLLKNYGFAEEFYRWGTGIVADLWSTNYDRMKKIPIPYPEIEEQKKISRFLDDKVIQIDSIIENTKVSIEELKGYKKLLISEVVTKGLDLSMQMRKSGVDSIPNFPEHWNYTKIKYLLAERKERSIEGLEEPLSMSQKLGVVKTKDLDVPNPPSSNIGSKIVKEGDLVFNKLKAHLGVFAVSKYDGLVSPDYAVYYAINNSIVNVKFLEYLFKTPYYINEFNKYSRGIVIGLTRLYTSDLFNIKCAVPTLEEQNNIVNFLENKSTAIDSLVFQKEKLILEMEKYRASLIYEYVTGKKEVI